MKIVYREGNFYGVILSKTQLLHLCSMIGPTSSTNRWPGIKRWADRRGLPISQTLEPEVCTLLGVSLESEPDPLSTIYCAAEKEIRR